MRILNWVQNKLNGGEKKKKRFAHSASTPHAEKEPKDWPQALLAIGTFGNTESKENPPRDDHSRDFDPDLSDFFIEEVDKLQKELKRLTMRKSKSSSSIGAEISEEEDRNSLPLNRFLNCPSSLEVERKISLSIERLTSENNGDLSPNTKVILNKVKDLLLGNHNAIKKNSISFLLKKMFLCHSGFAPARSLRVSVPESRMEKIIRAILTKKMHQQQNSSQTSSKKYLQSKPIEKTQPVIVEEENTEEDQSKWVKTDSNFIVLEI